MGQLALSTLWGYLKVVFITATLVLDLWQDVLIKANYQPESWEFFFMTMFRVTMSAWFFGKTLLIYEKYRLTRAERKKIEMENKNNELRDESTET
jgi:hypothetical protein